MSIYLGTLGRMIALKCPSSQQLSMEGEPVFTTTLEGRRVSMPQPMVGRRTWQNQLSDASTPAQIAAVMAFVNGEWGVGPFVFVSTDAPVTNLLSPAAASSDFAEGATSAGFVLTRGGPLETPDGWAGRSYLKVTSIPMFFGTRLPLPPSGKVTASAYVRGNGGAVRITFYNTLGVQIGFEDSIVTSTASTTVRSHITLTPPTGAASCHVGTNFPATQATRPAFTWTDTLFDWADGQGCPQAIIHAPSRNLIMASRDPRGGRYSNLSFTVSEVG